MKNHWHIFRKKETKKNKIIFLQVTDPLGYPPIINAAKLLAKNNAEVYLLGSPIKQLKFSLPHHNNIHFYSTRLRNHNFVSIGNYIEYCIKALLLTYKIRPNYVYVSDPLGAFPALMVAIIFRLKVIYHEHDSPTNESSLNLIVRVSRSLIMKISKLVIFPNEKRGLIVQRSHKFNLNKLRVIWNTPLTSEIPSIYDLKEKKLILYYHGTITPERLPENLLAAIKKFQGSVELRVVGYEVPSAIGYVEKLMLRWNDKDNKIIEYLGLVESREDLLQCATNNAHVGVALMPLNSSDINMKHMLGASNKAFDYMACGLPLIISEIPDWENLFVKDGFGKSCDPFSIESLENVIKWYLDNVELRSAMGKKAYSKIKNDWNYDNHFNPIIKFIFD